MMTWLRLGSLDARPVIITMAALVLGSSTARVDAQVYRGPIPWQCQPLEACEGQWTSHVDLGIAAGGDCDGLLVEDDIGHAVVIPVGPYAGYVIVWTACDQHQNYTAWICDVERNAFAPVPVPFPADHAYPDISPFNSTHAWMLDVEGGAKLLAVGGRDYSAVGSPCPGGESDPSGTQVVSWFDPTVAAWDAAPAPLDAVPPIPVGHWDFSNAVLMHTLKPTAAWPASLPLPDPDSFAAANYDLDRVIAYGGVSAEGGPQGQAAMAITAELRVPSPDPATWSWKRKADCPSAAVYGGLVVLPDGSLARMGGQLTSDVPPPTSSFYLWTSERFFPMEPNDPGVWIPMATRLPGTPPRGHRSVPGLLQSGALFLLGGRQDTSDDTLANPEVTVEIYKPPYFYRGARPALVCSTLDLVYGVPFCVKTRVPSSITHAVLIGISSGTQHFDFGQRYIELLVSDDLPGLGCTGEDNLVILPPPRPAMAPANFYVLYLLDDAGRPSNGVYVRLMHGGGD